jgi:quinol-cytochrome oxidoreductase complex cytochrome b subunit
MTHAFDPGGFQKVLLLGANDVGQEALIRFYVLHCVVLPIILAGVVALHFWRIRRDGGLAKPGPVLTSIGKGAPAPGTPADEPSAEPRKSYGLMCVVRDQAPATNKDPADTVPSWPYLMRFELLVLMVCVLVTVALGLAFDAPLKEIANPSVPENPAKAPWYFLGLQEMVSYSAFAGGLVIPLLVVVGLGLIPYLDRERREPGALLSGEGDGRIFRASLVYAAVLAVVAVALPVKFGWLRQWFPAIPQLIITAVNPGTLLTLGYMVWSLVVLQRKGSTRAAAIALFTCFLVGFLILTYVGTYLRGPNWGFYWSRASWPTH